MSKRIKSPDTELSKIRHRGFLAGLNSRSADICPYTTVKAKRGAWMEGWREGREQYTRAGNLKQSKHLRKCITNLAGTAAQ